MDRHTGRLSQTCALEAVWIMSYFLLVSFSQSFWFVWFTVHMWYISILSGECTHLLAKVDSTEKALWVEHPLTLLPASACKEPFCACVVGEVWLPEWEISGLNRAQPPPLIVLLLSWSGVSVYREWISNRFTLGEWGGGCPSTSYLKSWREKFQVSKRFNIQCY